MAKMRKLVFLGLLLLLTGCQNTVGPLAPRSPERVDDPSLPIAEQQRRARERYALPDQARTLLPNTSTAPPDTFRP
jgi:hypothetical protein